jgi:CheY-like chemotaxis protein
MILVVDDHLDTGAALARLLRMCGHEAVAVASGAAALEFIEATRPSVMVMDTMMPQMHGLEVLRRMRDDPRLRDIPVIIYSADDRFDVARQARDLGAKEFIVKGTVSWEQLCVTIARHAAA